jgi:gamma-carbonic anhydrase
MTAAQDSPFLLAYKGVSPTFKGQPRFTGPGSAVLGRVTIGSDAILQPFAVMRADGHVIEAGGRFYLGHDSTVHIAHELYGVKVGEHVTVGKNSVVHACNVGDGCVIEDNVVVLDGASIGEGSLVAAGSMVFSRAILPAGQWYEGSPAVAIRPLAPGELHVAHDCIREGGQVHGRIETAQRADSLLIAGDQAGYIAATVTVTGGGPLRMEEGSSVWFGCVLELGHLGVAIASNANVQDNSILRSEQHQVRVGEGSTIGHNVLLHDCVIGAQSLVGMGTTLSPGTIVMDHTLVAAGSCTAPGQVLDTGWLWAGRPARPIARMNERWRRVIESSAGIYREYAIEFAANQGALLGADVFR